ncbi:hypothetical protein NDU88_004860 [Pleurodeles waltl]|uniref:Uncharacterized protein n=1 Tax=Pleurodeles waltl TaxID=8319 RepID=A0AAV7VK45_PLEWA|nr:hypothetical protein NDU88_004860 [Pleurodeles waltl]
MRTSDIAASSQRDVSTCLSRLTVQYDRLGQWPGRDWQRDANELPAAGGRAVRMDLPSGGLAALEEPPAPIVRGTEGGRGEMM